MFPSDLKNILDITGNRPVARNGHVTIHHNKHLHERSIVNDLHGPGIRCTPLHNVQSELPFTVSQATSKHVHGELSIGFSSARITVPFEVTGAIIVAGSRNKFIWITKKLESSCSDTMKI
jgi:hypothetical protein